MKNKIYAFVCCAITSYVLVGCVGLESYHAARSGIDEANKKIGDAPSALQDAAIYITTPPVDLSPIKPPEGPEWLDREISSKGIELASLPFDVVVDEVLAGTGIMPSFSYEMQAALPVSLIHLTGTIRQGLDKLAARTNYTYRATDTAVFWDYYETENFVMPDLGGEYSFLVGKDSEGGEQQQQSGQGGIDTSAFDVDRKQYSNIKGEKLNVYSDAVKTINSMIGGKGKVIPTQSTASIFVKTTPDRMRQVRIYMDSIIGEMLSQVLLDIKIIRVTTSSSSDTGINWRAVKETTQNLLSFSGESPSFFTGAVPIAFSSTRVNSDGSVEALISALEEQGDVAFLTEERIMAVNGRVSELELSEIEGYVQSRSLLIAGDSGTTQAEINPGIIQDGASLYVLPRIFDDRVLMAVSSRSSDLKPFETAGDSDNFVQLPKMESNRLNLQVVIKNGTTVVAAAIRQETNRANKNSPISSKWASTYAGAQKEITDIYVLVTPRIFRNL